jgi:RHS repeat-associated protein
MVCANRNEQSRDGDGAVCIRAAIGQDGLSRLSTNSVTVNVVGSANDTNDSNGNLTSDGVRNFAYNDENQLIAVWVASAWSNSFAYDGFMRKRIEQDFAWNGSGWTETNEVHYVFDGNLVLQERDKNNEPLTTYTRGVDLSGTFQAAGGIGGLLARSDNQKIVPAILCPEYPNPQNVVTSFYFSDDQGNITALVSLSGMILAQYEYDPFGNLISKSGLMADINKYRYSSQEWEQNAGLYCYLYRFYDPSLQRWLNRDPNGELGFSVLQNLGCSKADEAQNALEFAIAGLNLYLFVNNNGLVFIDADGLNWFKNIWNWLKNHAPPWNAPPPFPPGSTTTPWFPPSPPGKHGASCAVKVSRNNDPPPLPPDRQSWPWTRTAPPPLPDH